MKTTEKQIMSKDLVIEEVHRHKDAIAREFGNDIGAYLAALRKRQIGDPRVVPSTKGEQCGDAKRD